MQADWSKKLHAELAPARAATPEDVDEDEEEEDKEDPAVEADDEVVARLKAELAAAKARQMREGEESQKRAASLPSVRPAHGAVEKHTPGQLPGYLVRRKLREQRRSEEEQQARLAQRAKPPPGFRLVPAAERAAAEKATRKLLEETMALFLKVSHDVPASSAQGSRHR